MELFNLLLAILGAIVAFLLVVSIHEFGHYCFARAFKVKVFTFSIGFGRAIFSKRLKSGLHLVIGWFPLGGYVRFWDNHEESFSDQEVGTNGGCFADKNVLARMAVIVAGPLFNFLLAIIVLTVFFLNGETVVRPVVGQVAPHSLAAKAGIRAGDELTKVGQWKTHSWQSVMVALSSYVSEKRSIPIVLANIKTKKQVVKSLNLSSWNYDGTHGEILNTVGIRPYFPHISAKVKQVVSGTPAQKAGLLPGDLIVEFANKPVSGWRSLVKLVEIHKNQNVTLRIKRHDYFLTRSLRVGQRIVDGKQVGFLGVYPKVPALPVWLLSTHHYSFINSLKMAFVKVGDLVQLQAIFLKKLVVGQLSVKTLGGPAMIFYSAGKATLSGFGSFLSFVGLLSVILGFVNLLPIPGLDGGHLFFCFIELCLGRPVTKSVQQFWLVCGIAFLVSLVLLATINDFSRFFG